MTRKDYILIAAALNKAREFLESNGDSTVGFAVTVESLTADLQADNARFDAARFINACNGVK
jgi:hypothetical protein